MNNVLVLGAGRVARPLTRYLLSKPGYRVIVASLEVTKGVMRLLARHIRAGFIKLDVTDTASLRPLVLEADVVVALLPAQLLPDIAKLCIENRRPLINTSYVSPELEKLDEAAKRKGILILCETGLDPGIDHMSAVRMIRRERAAGGEVVRFMSCCGGLPAPDANTNPWGYKFSWHPKGVLMAARQPAKFIRAGQVVEVPANELFDNRWRYEIDSLGAFEIYPNRDSTRYVEAYRLDGVEGFFRGTIRYPGWCETLKAVSELGLLDVEEVEFEEGATYADLALRRTGGEGQGCVAQRVAEKLGIDVDHPVIARLEWAGLLSDRPLGKKRAAPIDLLADRLEKLMLFEPGERDLVALKHTLTSTYPDGRTEVVTSVLTAMGDPWGDSAMARTVGLPAAIATHLLLEGEIGAVGVQIPVLPEIYEPVLDELEDLGFAFKETRLAFHPGPLDRPGCGPELGPASG